MPPIKTVVRNNVQAATRMRTTVGRLEDTYIQLYAEVVGSKERNNLAKATAPTIPAGPDFSTPTTLIGGYPVSYAGLKACEADLTAVQKELADLEKKP